jgi:N-methylhydantoinase B/acetone carboxylase alpha subunit
MSNSETPTATEPSQEYDRVDPPIGWDGQTLNEMLTESERLLDETGHYQGIDTLEMKEEEPFEYERMYSRLRGALVNARETALHISASPIVREIGELCFQIYTPEGDCVALSTGIIVHVHTGSLAIKWMIEQDYEHDRGINPGDIFCNNDNDLGNVHTTDVHTYIPVFHDGELIAWVDGVTHEVDIGSAYRGHSQIATTNRQEDGLFATCEKIGEDGELYQDWKERAQRQVRTPQYWDLDEKCRLAGCQMAKEAIIEMIEDVGVETFKQFMYEAVEEGRRTMKSRVKERLFPGTYREASFCGLPFSDEAFRPSQRVDMFNHLPVECEVDAEGTLSLDMEGVSPPGPHPNNAAEGSMEGGLWVSLTQCLLHDGKVNDGSHFAMETNFPEGSLVNPQDPELSYSNPWMTIQPTFNAVWKNLSRGFFARGFREEVVTGYSATGDSIQGGGTLEGAAEYMPVGPFDISCQGLGASAIRDGLDYGYAMWNPESDMGDVEEWEQVEMGFPHLGRSLKPNSAGYGKYRGGAGWEAVRMAMGYEDLELFNLSIHDVTPTTSGMAGGYPGGMRSGLRAHNTDMPQRIQNGDDYPVRNATPGEFESNIEGDIVKTEYGSFFPTQFEDFDVVRYQMGGGPGYGDPLEREVELVAEDVEEGVYTPDVVEQVYGVVGDYDEDDREFTVDDEATAERREEIREERKSESQSFEDFREKERENVVEKDMSEPVKWMYDGVFEQSSEWADRFRDYWDLDEEYTVRGGEGQ